MTPTLSFGCCTNIRTSHCIVQCFLFSLLQCVLSLFLINEHDDDDDDDLLKLNLSQFFQCSCFSDAGVFGVDNSASTTLVCVMFNKLHCFLMHIKQQLILAGVGCRTKCRKYGCPGEVHVTCLRTYL